MATEEVGTGMIAEYPGMWHPTLHTYILDRYRKHIVAVRVGLGSYITSVYA